MFHYHFERKNDKVLTFNIAHFPNFKISASLLLAPPSTKRRNSQFQRKYGTQTMDDCNFPVIINTVLFKE